MAVPFNTESIVSTLVVFVDSEGDVRFVRSEYSFFPKIKFLLETEFGLSCRIGKMFESSPSTSLSSTSSSSENGKKI